MHFRVRILTFVLALGFLAANVAGCGPKQGFELGRLTAEQNAAEANSRGIFDINAAFGPKTGPDPFGGGAEAYRSPHIENPVVAVYPLVNYSGTLAPLEELRTMLIDRLREHGIEVLEEKALQAFMARHRVRHTGGIDHETASAMRKETSANGVLITSLGLYEDAFPPKLALNSRLVTTGADPRVIWLDGFGITGTDRPGLLDLGVVRDSTALGRQVAEKLAISLVDRLFGEIEKPAPRDWGRPYVPKMIYRNTDFIPRKKVLRVAVLPILNESSRRRGSDVIQEQFGKAIVDHPRMELVEPGIIRAIMLEHHMVMPNEPSLADAEIAFAKSGADLLITGTLRSYEDHPAAAPEVDFSTTILDRQSKTTVISAQCFSEGDDRVLLFDFGRVHTAHVLAARMTRSLLYRLMDPVSRPPTETLPERPSAR